MLFSANIQFIYRGSRFNLKVNLEKIDKKRRKIHFSPDNQQTNLVSRQIPVIMGNYGDSLLNYGFC